MKNLFTRLANNHIYKIISILFTTIISLLIVLIIKANDMAHNNPSRIAAINEIITESTTAHLWLEEIIGGDTNEKYDIVQAHINTAKTYAQYLIKENDNQITKALDDKKDLQFIEKIYKQLNEFDTITNTRFENITDSQIGSDIDQVYDGIFKNMVEDLKLLKNRIIKKQEIEKKNFTTIQYIIIFFEILSFSLVSLAIYSYTKNKEKLIQKDKILIRQSKMIIMGEMIENIAHQWRQPLSFISTMASSIQMEKEHNMLKEEKLVDNMESILSNVNYLSQTIDDFRQFYKSDHNKASFYLDSALDNIFKIVRFDKSHEQIEYLKKDYSNIQLHTYKNELLQVLINIINNAKDQLTDNEILCHLDKVIYLTAKQENKQNIITIHDNGGGIPDDILEDIFSAYFTTKGEEKGTGIGLYISKDIVEHYLGGTIQVENQTLIYKEKEYLGAKFTITIPQ